MKKKLGMMLCVLTLAASMSMNVMAAVSPVGEKDNTPSVSKTATAPKTGEGDLVFYGIAAAALLAGTAVLSKKRLEKQD